LHTLSTPALVRGFPIKMTPRLHLHFCFPFCAASSLSKTTLSFVRDASLAGKIGAG